MSQQENRLIAFELDDQCFGLHLDQVERVVRAALPTPLPGGPDILLGVLNVHGTLAPVFNVRRRLGKTERELDPRDHFIIAQAGRRVVLPVDRVRGMVDHASPMPANADASSKLVEGIVRMDDGLLLIHNLDQFLTLMEGSMLEAAILHAESRVPHA